MLSGLLNRDSRFIMSETAMGWRRIREHAVNIWPDAINAWKLARRQVSNFLTSGNLEHRISGNPDFRKSGFPDIPDIRISWYSGYLAIPGILDIRIFRNTRISGNPEIRIADFRKKRYPKIRISGYPDADYVLACGLHIRPDWLGHTDYLLRTVFTAVSSPAWVKYGRPCASSQRGSPKCMPFHILFMRSRIIGAPSFYRVDIWMIDTRNDDLFRFLGKNSATDGTS